MGLGFKWAYGLWFEACSAGLGLEVEYGFRV